MVLADFLATIESVLPSGTAMDGDRLGLQVQSGRNEISSVLTCLDVTPAILDEAIERGCDCVLTFHPLIFAPLVAVTDQSRIGRCIYTAIKKNITLISAHTNFDAHPLGTNHLLAQELNLMVERTLVPDSNVRNHGMGVVCATSPLTLQKLLQRVRTVCSSPLRFSSGNGTEITRVAIVAGSGSGFLDEALASGAQAFITADVKYHTFFRAEGRIAVIDPGHYEMERFVPQGLADVLSNAVTTNADAPVINATKLNTNPIEYLH